MSIIEGAIARSQADARPGATFLVDPDGDGYTTIAAALADCLSGRGDTVLVMPGTYEENLVVTKDYVAIIGALGGYGKPDVIPATGVALIVRAQGFYTDRMRYASDGQDSDVVQIEGNGGVIGDDVVFDGDTAMGDTKAILRMWTHTSDDSFTGSEWKVGACLIRGSGGFGLALDCKHAAVGVLPTDNYFHGVRFADNDKEDIYVAATAVAVNGLHRTLFDSCKIGLGTSKNKATHVDLKTHKIGTPDTEFVGCFINDDTVNTTALKVDGVGCSLIGCYSLDGVIDGDALD